MPSLVTPWDKFDATLSEAQRAATEGRFGDFMTLGARLERAAATLPPPAQEQIPALQHRFAELCGVLSHIEAVHGALAGIRAELRGPYERRLLDQRG